MTLLTTLTPLGLRDDPNLLEAGSFRGGLISEERTNKYKSLIYRSLRFLSLKIGKSSL